jgi:microcystin-dependent protein
MAEPFLSEIRMMAFGFPPKGWALCNGQLLPISQNQALFSLLGTTYGGDGRVNFGLPNLQGRVPVGFSYGIIGQLGGEASHTLTPQETSHSHAAKAAATAGDDPSPQNRAWGIQTTAHAYASGGAGAKMADDAVATVGGSGSHNNMPPYLVINFCIALQGIFPSQN